MEQVRERINEYLDRVHSLENLTREDVLELRHISKRSLVIDKFRVSSADYMNWIENILDRYVRGVEYDDENERLVLREHPVWMHEVAIGEVSRVFSLTEDILTALTGKFFFITGSANYMLRDGYRKQADQSIMQSEGRIPFMVLEVAVSDTTDKLHEDAQRWLNNGITKLVILVDIKETGQRDCSNDKWGISEAEVRQTGNIALSERVLQWYQSQGIRLVGSFDLSVHLWSSDGNRQCILDGAKFSPGNLIDPTTVDDVPLPLGHLIPDVTDRDLDPSQRVMIPLRRLVHSLQHGFKAIEWERACDLAWEERQKFAEPTSRSRSRYI